MAYAGRTQTLVSSDRGANPRSSTNFMSDLKKEADRLIAQRMLIGMARTPKGRAAIVASCRTYILNKAGELAPAFMPTMSQLHSVEGQVSDAIELALDCGLELDMVRLNAMCDRMAASLVEIKGE